MEGYLIAGLPQPGICFAKGFVEPILNTAISINVVGSKLKAKRHLQRGCHLIHLISYPMSSLDKRGIADFDELLRKKVHRILRSCLLALYSDPTMLIEIAVHIIGAETMFTKVSCL